VPEVAPAPAADTANEDNGGENDDSSLGSISDACEVITGRLPSQADSRIPASTDCPPLSPAETTGSNSVEIDILGTDTVKASSNWAYQTYSLQYLFAPDSEAPLPNKLATPT
jgi:hypothetical protein